MQKQIQMTMVVELLAIATLISCSGARAGDLVGPRSDDLTYEFFEPYLERIEGVTVSAGNARDVNAVTHMIDPWPRNVRNRRIPFNGERMVGAVDRYRHGRPAAPPITPVYNTTGLQYIAPTTQGAPGPSTGSTAAPTQ